MGVALASLLAVALIASTFAYWNQTSSIENPFDTGTYGSTVKEDFKPSDGENWQPGVEINKDVVAVNTGDQDIIVRVRLDETWARSATSSVTPGQVYKDSIANNYNVYTTAQANATDGLTALDGSVVTKNFATSANWIQGAGGWYYYRVNLAGGQTSDRWLDSVELLNDADMGNMQTKYYVTTSTGANEATWVWVEYTGSMPAYLNALGQPSAANAPGAQPVLHNKAETTYVTQGGVNLIGYSESDYTLTVTVESVQPTQEALDAVFGGGSSFAAPAGTAWTLK